MRCEDAIGLFTQYRDGDLDPRIRADLEAHLAGCDKCRAEYEAIDAVRALLHELPPESMPATLVAGVRAQLRRRPERPREVLRRWALPAAATAALVVIALGVLRVYEGRPKYEVGMTRAAPTPFGMRMPEREQDLATVRRNAAAARARIEEKARSGEAPPGDMSAPIGGEHAAPSGRGRLRLGGREAGELSEMEERQAPVSPAQTRLRRGLAAATRRNVGVEPTAAPKAKPAPSPAYGPQFSPAQQRYPESTDAVSRAAGAAGKVKPPPAAAPPAPPGPAGAKGPAGPARVAAVAEPSSEAGRPSSAPSARDESAGYTIPQGASKTAAPSAAGRPSAEARLYTAPALPPRQKLSVSAQANRTQQAAGNITLNVRTPQDIADAQVAVRPARPGGRETVVWQGRLDKDSSNSLNIPVIADRRVARAAPQLVVVSGSHLSPERFYVFAPESAAAQQVAKERSRAQKSGKGIQLPPQNWERTLQTLANANGVYVLAPGGFPMHTDAQVAEPLANRDVSTALNQLGYRMSQEEGVIKVEPSARAKQPVRAGRPPG